MVNVILSKLYTVLIGLSLLIASIFVFINRVIDHVIGYSSYGIYLYGIVILKSMHASFIIKLFNYCSLNLRRFNLFLLLYIVVLFKLIR